MSTTPTSFAARRHIEFRRARPRCHAVPRLGTEFYREMTYCVPASKIWHIRRDEERGTCPCPSLFPFNFALAKSSKISNQGGDVRRNQVSLQDNVKSQRAKGTPLTHPRMTGRRSADRASPTSFRGHMKARSRPIISTHSSAHRRAAEKSRAADGWTWKSSSVGDYLEAEEAVKEVESWMDRTWKSSIHPVKSKQILVYCQSGDHEYKGDKYRTLLTTPV
ncbi:hypothetical protein EDD18DRAFT_1105773 [Armillaria luteobubalina]|uniref:Uncharacterized protein n=1 Tax=Armillaria luteobubalina TaxID=153913 RepID=A0AA39Q608_9AGAR|nr:hypothetical protein EDD18DRAFT_1105773 [Armillaria luteobubalina]